MECLGNVTLLQQSLGLLANRMIPSFPALLGGAMMRLHGPFSSFSVVEKGSEHTAGLHIVCTEK
jgi:hypothetical protein